MECGSVSALSVDHSERLVPTRLHVVMCPHPVAKARMCVSTAPGVCVSTAPGVCALGWVEYREHISLLVIIMYVTKKKNPPKPIMVKCCLNIGISIDKPKYRLIST